MSLKIATAFGLQSITTGMETNSVTGTPTVETTIKRSNGTALRFAPGATKTIQWNVYSAGQGIHYYRIYFHIVTSVTSDGTPIVSIDNSSNRKVDIRLRPAVSSNKLQLYNSEDSVQIGSDSGALSTGGFYRLELKVDSTTLASTSVEARLYAASDEATLLWNPSGTIDLTVDPNRFTLSQRNDSTLDIVFTDIVIIRGDATAPNDWAGEGSLVYLRPDGDSAVAWTRGGADSGANWSQVDETTPTDATDYVESNTSGQVDDYTLSATPAAVGATDTINWVVAGARFAISNSTGGDPDAVLRATINGSLSESGNISGAGSTSYFTNNVNSSLLPPLVITTAGITKAQLDAALGGMRESVSDTHLIRVAAYWLMFDHKPTPASATVWPLPGAQLNQAVNRSSTY
jgi:hypothetical protein